MYNIENFAVCHKRCHPIMSLEIWILVSCYNLAPRCSLGYHKCSKHCWWRTFKRPFQSKTHSPHYCPSVLKLSSTETQIEGLSMWLLRVVFKDSLYSRVKIEYVKAFFMLLHFKGQLIHNTSPDVSKVKGQSVLLHWQLTVNWNGATHLSLVWGG